MGSRIKCCFRSLLCRGGLSQPYKSNYSSDWSVLFPRCTRKPPRNLQNQLESFAVVIHQMMKGCVWGGGVHLLTEERGGLASLMIRDCCFCVNHFWPGQRHRGWGGVGGRQLGLRNQRSGGLKSPHESWLGETFCQPLGTILILGPIFNPLAGFIQTAVQHAAWTHMGSSLPTHEYRYLLLIKISQDGKAPTPWCPSPAVSS